jgi:glycosyltransferase involved in cell wall biosynthesis
LLRAYARVEAETGWGLVVVGAAGWSYEPIFATAEALGLADKVVFAGFSDPEQLPLWYNAAGMLVYPSVYEGFGLPALEAMACGTPVIAANNSALPEVVGEAGLLVGAKDVEAMAHSISILARDPELRQELSQRGRQRAAGYSWRKTAEATLGVYHDAVSLAGRRAGKRMNEKRV